MTNVLLVIEVGLFLLVGLPLSIRGTVRLIRAVRESTASDRLARAITLYLTLVTITTIYVLGLTAIRVLTGSEAIGGLRPLTTGLLLLICLGPWWIERNTRNGEE